MFHFDRFSHIFKIFHPLIVKGVRKISSYAFKMRQDYLSTRYLDQFISPSFASLTREIFLIQVTSAEIILSHFECI